ncbi:MAG TPA: symmetrical bis(5'-nucleosyl)-tetraphosphatase [Mariprofundaceae bacterium]|nr:symmetrical bis(5'-nucleosyl)-tetraphosphatase [Mariprofundaceae bacterium]
MAVYGIGDIQGCFDPLKRLLDKLGFDPNSDTIWCAGDLVNRGPASLDVLRFLKSLGDACICVLGNHDLHLLGQLAGEAPYTRDTLEGVLTAPDRDELIDWLRHRRLLHHDAALNWCMVHAGLHPAWTLGKAKRRAARIEKVLQSDDWRDFSRHLHHREFPDCDPRDDGLPATLFATAVLTRSRYCTAEGCFNWTTRAGGPTDEEFPWFAHDDLAWRDETRVLCGHWAALGLITDQPHVLGLDSGCVWGGRLTAARLDADVPELTHVECKACQTIG